MRRRYMIVLTLFLLVTMLVTAGSLSAAPRVAILEVKGMVCEA